MKILRAADHRVTRWKNGMGETREVAAAHNPDDPAGFLWRVSMATVAADSPFSHFPGIDRTIAVMQGRGMRLNVDGIGVQVSNAGKPYSFAGEATVNSALIDGPTIDLNAMSLRSHWSHKMTRLDGNATHVESEARVSVLVFNVPADVTFGGVYHKAEPLDVIADIAPGVRIEITGAPVIDVFLIEFDQLR